MKLYVNRSIIILEFREFLIAKMAKQKISKLFKFRSEASHLTHVRQTRNF